MQLIKQVGFSGNALDFIPEIARSNLGRDTE